MTVSNDHVPNTVELRIHGVSGTPVTSLLDVSVVRRVAGDDDSGFWHRGEIPDPEIPQHYKPRRKDGTVAELDVVLEGYRWGGLTSGAAKAAVWVLFAPFALVNAAAAAHMPGKTKPEQRRGIAPGIEGALLRLFALSLSFTLVFAVYISAVDIVGWQCGNPLPGNPEPLCTRHPSYTHFLFWHFDKTPAKHIVVTMLIPILVIALIWKFASQSWQRYEAFAPGPSLPVLKPGDEVPPGTHPLVRADNERTPFDDPAFWDGRERTEMLRHLHVAGCLTALTAMVTAAWIAVRGPHTSICVPVVMLVLALLVLAIVVIFTAIGFSTWRRQATYGLLAVAGALLVVTLATMWGAKLGRNLPAELPAVGRTVTLLFATQLLLVLAISLIGIVAIKRSGEWKAASTRTPGLWGLTSAALCMLSLVFAGMFAAGAILRVADLMGPARARTEIGTRTNQIITPDALQWMARGTLLGAALLVLLLLGVGIPLAWRILHPGSYTEAEPPSMFEGAAPAGGPAALALRRRNRAVQRTRDIAALTDHAGTFVGPAMIIAFGAAAAATIFAVYSDFFPKGGWPVVQDNEGFQWRIWTASAGSWLIVGFAGALLATMVRAYRSPDKRRQVGILWDLATFWPRSAHPWAPPCYAERTVPEYAARATFLRYDPATFTAKQQKVVLSAHSQGSIIAAATLLQLGDTGGIGLLTYGCPLARLYAKYFPSYFGDPTLGIIYDRMGGRWRNLSRKTDPIGGPVTIASQAEVDVDVPIPTQKNPGDTDYPPIEGHSRYPREAVYAQRLLEVRNLL